MFGQALALFGRDELEENKVLIGFDAELPTIGESDWKTTSVDQVFVLFLQMLFLGQ